MMMIQFEFVLLLVDVRVDDLFDVDDNAGLIVFLFNDGIDDLSC